MTWELPGYVVEELLGFGASGEVWRARGSVTGEVVALKRLRGGRAPAERERLRREAGFLAAFEHPHVVRLHGVLDTAGGPVLVLDHADGGSLGGLVARRGPCSPGELIGLLAPVADALAAAHGIGLVHGDVSAGNILLGGDGRALLADLGTARLVTDDGGTPYGTAGFIDPAVRAGRSPGPASDVYALGAVAVYALTGAALTGAAGLADPAAALPASNVPESLRRVLRRALAADPAARPSAATLARDLLAAGAPEPLDTRAVAFSGSPTARTHAVRSEEGDPGRPRESGRHRSAAVRGRLGGSGRRVAGRCAAAAILVAAAVGAGLLWGGARPGEQPAGAAAAAQRSWGRVWADLDTRRARAFATTDAMLLDQVYLPGCSALPVDLGAVRALAARHVHATGVEHQARTVRAESVAADSVTLLVVDRMRGYDIRDVTGRVLTHVPPRGDRSLRVTLARTRQGWRIAQMAA
jgi:hypothetical protein